MSWENEDKDKGWTRRDWVKVGVTAGAVGAVLGLGGLTMGQILPPPLKFSGEIRATLPDGFSLYFDDPTLDAANNGTRIVVLFDRCVHLCCYPGWHVINNPPPDRNYVVPPPTYVQFAENPVYCICHGSQYDPLLLIVDVNPKNDARYVGAERVHGPAPRALPVIPVKAQGLNLVGGMADPAWYIY